RGLLGLVEPGLEARLGSAGPRPGDDRMDDRRHARGRELAEYPRVGWDLAIAKDLELEDREGPLDDREHGVALEGDEQRSERDRLGDGADQRRGDVGHDPGAGAAAPVGRDRPAMLDGGEGRQRAVEVLMASDAVPGRKEPDTTGRTLARRADRETYARVGRWAGYGGDGGI